MQALALLAGVGTCLLLPQLPPWPWLALLFPMGLVAWRWRGWAQLPGVMLCGFALAGLHAGFTLARQLPAALEQQDITVSGRVLDLPQHEVRRTRFVLRVDADATQQAQLRGKRLQLAWYDDFKLPGNAQPVDMSAVAPGNSSPPRYRLHAGSRWKMTVRLRAPRGLRNPGGFDGEKQALADRIAATGYLRNPEEARQLAPASGIDAWRERMSARIAHSVDVPSSRFIRALALGDTRAIDDIDWEQLRAVGVTHLIAISGFHVGIVAGFFTLLASLVWRLLPSLGRRMPRHHAAAMAALMGALGYAAIAGFALPTVRTVLMIAVVVMAKLLRRSQRMVDVLVLSAMAILLADPLSLLAPGFWLSFAGVAWLLWCLPMRATNPGGRYCADSSARRRWPPSGCCR